MSEWRPIETAPRDGTHVLVYYEFATVPIAHVAFWDADEHDLWQSNGFSHKAEQVGWWSYVENSVSAHKLEGHNTPTHWMPLPAPPASEPA